MINKGRMKEIIKDEKRYENVVLMTLAVFVGIVTGISSIIFNKFLEIFHYGLYDGQILMKRVPLKIKFLIIPIVGGLLVGIIGKYFISKEDKGFGVSRVIQELDDINKFLMKPRIVFLKTFQTIVTLGSGLSAGRQGPIVHLGGAIGSIIGYKFNFDETKIRILIGCGVAGSIAGVFNTPISATIFVLEILMHKDCLRYFTPIVISSITSVVMTRFLIGNKVFLSVRGSFGILSYRELLYYVVLGILLGFLAIVYIKLIEKTKWIIKKIKISHCFHPAIGAFVVVIIGYFLPYIFDIEYGTIGKIIEDKFNVKLLIFLLIGKIVATAATLGSGGVGGVFLPGLYIGAAFGSIYGNLLCSLVPNNIYNVSSYSLVGMGAMFAAFADAPITATIMILELTNTYSIILPILLSCAVGSATIQLIYPKTIYTVSIKKD
ncbi:chloride channel protein, CIC family [Caminicella sporogenes DSM 14501]|uniref:Chloride channel protein, CIC family n=1 Tax=Caminicella sporogenes DSM 14501 TaxID=1121266 RepID=A0A1M6QU33_9FIRM|nr:chloride channel protein [Caminicella sporogenes]RKD20909.1 hypothetical protein BET04_08740 [Caminicella sporogenes]SHK23792.1 chloride channel protein, CIC family [Caminicella sporogenes DSM 14501]